MTTQTSNIRNQRVLAFNLPARARLACRSLTASRQAGHWDLNCHLDFDTWVSPMKLPRPDKSGLVMTRRKGLVMTPPLVIARHDSAEAISWGDWDR